MNNEIELLKEEIREEVSFLKGYITRDKYPTNIALNHIEYIESLYHKLINLELNDAIPCSEEPSTYGELECRLCENCHDCPLTIGLNNDTIFCAEYKIEVSCGSTFLEILESVKDLPKEVYDRIKKELNKEI